MLSVETEARVAKLLLSLAEGERTVEISRQVLSDNYDFDPYQIFRALDTECKNRVNACNILNFLKCKGIFANEAGTGTSTTVHATTKNTPLEQGLWGIVEVAFVSFIMCTITALLVMTTNAWTSGLDGAPMVLEAFKGVYGTAGKYILCIMICLFAYTTYIGFYYEYTTCIRYIFKDKVANYFKWLYLVPLLIAVFLPIEFIWTMADMSVGFIIIPNIISLMILTPKFKEILKKEKKILKVESV
jgi:AGCS family alanine or glycine:cation symporter